MDIARQYVRQFLNEELSDKEKYYLDKIRSGNFPYRSVPKEYRTPEFHMELLKIDPIYLTDIKPSLQTQEMVDFAIKKNPRLLFTAAVSKRTKELCDYIADNISPKDLDGLVLANIPGKFKTPEILKKLIAKLSTKKDVNLFSGANAKNVTPEVLDMYVQKFGYSSLIYACQYEEGLFGSAITPDLIKKAIEEDPKVLKYVPSQYHSALDTSSDPEKLYSNTEFSDIPSEVCKNLSPDFILNAVKNDLMDLYDLDRWAKNKELSQDFKDSLFNILKNNPECQDRGATLADIFENSRLEHKCFCLENYNLDHIKQVESDSYKDPEVLKIVIQKTKKVMCIEDIDLEKIMNKDQLEDYLLDFIQEFGYNPKELEDALNNSDLMAIVSAGRRSMKKGIISYNLIENIPESWFTEKVSEIIIQDNPENLEEIPISARTLDVCKLAIKLDPSTRKYIPLKLRKDLN